MQLHKRNEFKILKFVQNFRPGFPTPHFCVWAGGWADREEAGVRYERGGAEKGGSGGAGGGLCLSLLLQPHTCSLFPIQDLEKIFPLLRMCHFQHTLIQNDHCILRNLAC